MIVVITNDKSNGIIFEQARDLNHECRRASSVALFVCVPVARRARNGETHFNTGPAITTPVRQNSIPQVKALSFSGQKEKELR
jgi:hypothetical protein